MKRFIAAILAASVVAVAVVPAGATGSSTGSRNIVQVASSLPQFTELVKLVKKAGLVSALECKSKLTVFAPTNAAFANVPAATLAKLGKDKTLLKSDLLYHVVAGERLATQVEKVSSLKTLEGATVKVKVKVGHIYINQAEVTEANVAASNGVIDVINAVLLPPGT
jgi:uncharacterized surface protein with fasciclin (FAS1) repeats